MGVEINPGTFYLHELLRERSSEVSTAAKNVNKVR